MSKKPELHPYSDRLSFASLPPRSLNEFFLWVQKYGASIQVIYPHKLRQRHLDSALALIKQYSK